MSGAYASPGYSPPAPLQLKRAALNIAMLNMIKNFLIFFSNYLSNRFYFFKRPFTISIIPKPPSRFFYLCTNVLSTQSCKKSPYFFFVGFIVALNYHYKGVVGSPQMKMIFFYKGC